MVSIRDASVNDVEALLDLRAVMFDAMDPGGAVTDWQGPCRQILLDGLLAGDLIGAVGETADGAVVASGVATVRRWLPSPTNPSGLKGYIGSMATLAPWRRQGIGRRITEHLIDALGRRGVTEIELHATEAGENVYRSLGFTSSDARSELTLQTDADRSERTT